MAIHKTHGFLVFASVGCSWQLTRLTLKSFQPSFRTEAINKGGKVRIAVCTLLPDSSKVKPIQTNFGTLLTKKALESDQHIRPAHII
jgi:hypothetical protein